MMRNRGNEIGVSLAAALGINALGEIDRIEALSMFRDKLEELKELIKVAKEIRNNADVLVVVGIGGSYLGAKAVIDMFSGYFSTNKPEVIFAHIFSFSSLTSGL